MRLPTHRSRFLSLVLLATVFLPAGLVAAADLPPKSWIDPDTGHRVIRLTDEPGSASLYFNDNGFTPDGKKMVYLLPKGLGVVDLTTLTTRHLVEGSAQSIVAGRKNPTFYYAKSSGRSNYSELWCVNVDTGESHKVVDLPRRGSIFSINADETLAAGVYVEGDAGLSPAPAKKAAAPAKAAGPATSQGGLYQAVSKEQMMTDRLAARYPEVLFTIDLRDGTIKNLLRTTDWIDHIQFSPTIRGFSSMRTRAPGRKSTGCGASGRTAPAIT